jgi:hypothetical protein
MHSNAFYMASVFTLMNTLPTYPTTAHQYPAHSGYLDAMLRTKPFPLK